MSQRTGFVLPSLPIFRKRRQSRTGSTDICETRNILGNSWKHVQNPVPWVILSECLKKKP